MGKILISFLAFAM